MENLFRKINRHSLSAFRQYLAMRGASHRSIKRKESSLRHFFSWAVEKGYLKRSPYVKDTPLRLHKFSIFHFPFSIRSYRALPYFTYLNFLILIVFLAALGFGIYQQFILKAPEKLAYPAAETRPKRYLSFQGRLTDSTSTPIEEVITMRFYLYNSAGSGSPPTGGILLWDSGDCSVDPDQDGIFAILLGTTSGDGYTCSSASEIASSVFSENAEVWLHIKVGSENLDPRIQIATVAYALNAETLQGFPASTSATANTVPVVNYNGDFLLAAASPTLSATSSGTFRILSRALSVQTETGTNGNVTIAPDGSGVLNLTFSSLGTGNAINAEAAQLGTSGGKEANTLYYGSVATNTNTNYNLLKLESGSPLTPKFTVDASGNASAAGYLRANTTGSYFTGDVTVSGGDITGASSVNLDIGEISSSYITSSVGFAVGGGTTYYLTNAGTLNVATINAFNLAGNITVNQDIDIIPAGTAGTNDLGSSSYPWDNLYANQVCLSGDCQISWPAGSNYWTILNGTIYPNNSTVDLLIGGTATSSAKFAFTNVLSGTPTATFSGNLVLAGGSRTISGTDMNPLTIGDASTGNIQLAAGSATPAFVLTTAGRVGIGTTNPLSELHVAGSGGFNSNLWAGGYAKIGALLDDNTDSGATSYFTVTSCAGSEYSSSSTKAYNGSSTTAYISQTSSTGISYQSYNSGGGCVNSSGSTGTVYAVDRSTTAGSLTTTGTASFNSGGVTIDSSNYVNAARFVDTAGSGAYFLDPAAAASLNVAGYATVAASLAVGYSTLPSGPGNAVFSGNVGIGTTSPAEALDINGRIRLAQTSAPAIVADRLYNVSGDLYWAGDKIQSTLYSGSNPSIASGSYLEVAHNGNTNDLLATGWIYDGSKWVEIDDLAKTTHSTQDPNLTAWYRMEEASGDLDNAEGTATKDLIDKGTPTYQQAGRVNYSIDLDGTDDYFCSGSGTTCADIEEDSFETDNAGTLTTNLIAYWKLDETGGTRSDSIGSNNLTDNNTVTSATGKKDKAAQFTAANSEYLSMTNGPVPGAGNFSVALWLKTSSSSEQYLFSINAGNNPQWSLRLLATSGIARFYVTDGGADYAYRDTSSGLNDNAWHHLLVTWTASTDTINLYVDGASNQGSQTTSGTVDSCNPTGTWTLGTQSTPAAYFNGLIDETGIWSKVLSSQEITDLYNSGNANTLREPFDFAAADNFSIGGWFKHDTIATNPDYMVTKVDSTNGGYKLYMENDGDITFGIDDDGTSFPEDSATTTVATYDDNTWHHVAAVKSGTSYIKLYIDGQEVASDTSLSATGSLANSGPFYLGIDSDGSSNLWDGVLDEMFVYSRALTPGEIEELYRSNSRFYIEQADANNVRLYNYSGATQNLRLAVVNGMVSTNNLWTDQGTYIYANNYTGFVITDSGNVGIGTTSPGQALEVNGTIRLTGAGGINLYSSAAGVLRISNTAGAATLTLQNDTAAAIVFSLLSGVSDHVSTIPSAGLSNYFYENSASGTNKVIRLYGYPSGAAANNYASFQIVGANNDLQIQTNNASGDILLNPNSGNVGIGTTSPGEKLEVAGNIKLSGVIKGSDIGARVYNNAALTIPTGTWTALAMNSERFDTDAIHDNVTNNSRLTCNTAGKYQISASIAWDTSTTGRRILGIYLNGTTLLGSQEINPANDARGITVSMLYELAVNDYVEAKAYQTSGANLDVLYAANQSPEFMMVRVAGADIAEYYPIKDLSLEEGDIVSIDPAVSQHIRKADKPYQKPIGIISTNPAMILGNTPDKENNRLVGLVGRVPVKVSSTNGPIKSGDSITTSSLPGVGMKATRPGPIVGKALEPFGTDGNTPEVCRRRNTTSGVEEEVPCGKIMIFVNVSWYDPDVFLTSAGELQIISTQTEQIATDETDLLNPSPSVKSVSFALVDSLGETVKRVGAFAELAVANLRAGLIETQTLITNNLITNEKIVSPLVETGIISPLPDSSDIIIHLGGVHSATSEVTGTGSSDGESGFGRLLIQNEQGETVASIDSEGKISADSLQINTDATISGTLYADEIITKHGKFGDLLAERITTTQVSAPSPTPTPELTASDAVTPEASDSALLAEVQNWEITDPSQDLKITSNLKVLGRTSLADTTIAGQLMVDASLTLGTSGINSLTGPLYLNSLGLGGVDILAGKVVIDIEGNVQVAGNLAVGGELTAQRLNLSGGSTSQGESGFGKLLTVVNKEGQEVVSIDSSGKISADSLLISADYSATQSATLAEIRTNATSGLGILPAGQTEFTIFNPKVSENTLVYLTPVSSTENKVLYVAAKKAGEWFKVGIDTPIESEIKFNWWIIN